MPGRRGRMARVSRTRGRSRGCSARIATRTRAATKATGTGGARTSRSSMPATRSRCVVGGTWRFGTLGVSELPSGPRFTARGMGKGAAVLLVGPRRRPDGYDGWQEILCSPFVRLCAPVTFTHRVAGALGFAPVQALRYARRACRFGAQETDVNGVDDGQKDFPWRARPQRDALTGRAAGRQPRGDRWHGYRCRRAGRRREPGPCSPRAGSCSRSKVGVEWPHARFAQAGGAAR